MDLDINTIGLCASFERIDLKFKLPAKTSRETLKTKDTYLLKVWDKSDNSIVGLGECSPLWTLSIDNKEIYQETLQSVCADIQNYKFWLNIGLTDFPSIKCGLEMAIADLKNGGERIYFPSNFTKKQKEIQINGLIWMGEYKYMQQQILDKIKNGFRCVKLKIGGINFEEELELLQLIRNDFSKNDIELRLDANGAFKPNDVFYKLEKLAKFDIHSIEQPIGVKQWELMQDLCLQSPIDIALDEELIGVKEYKEKKELINKIRPQYLIFKPSLIGGFVSTKEWIELCEENKIKWWLTSALESNIGLNALAQFVADSNNNLPQGLGTGGLFTNNTNSYLELKNDKLSFKGK